MLRIHTIMKKISPKLKINFSSEVVEQLPKLQEKKL